MKKQLLSALTVTFLFLTVAFMSFDFTSAPPPHRFSQDLPVVKDRNGNDLQVKYVRKNAHLDKKNMAILEAAMKKMKEMNCTEPASWYMQAAIHGAPYKPNMFCNEADYKKAVNEAWHNCTHDVDPLGLTKDGARTHFYTWHKLYLNHFEDMVREVTGEKDFVLPYWEYDNPKYQTLPPPLASPGSSLYEQYRSKNMNDGKPIDNAYYKINHTYGSKTHLQHFTTPDTALRCFDFHHMTRSLEHLPHNIMHVYMGTDPTNSDADSISGYDYLKDQYGQDSIAKSNDGYGYMYQNYSPMDPVFWVHHANIDRMYEQWMIKKIDTELTNGGRPTREEFLNNPWIYNFFEPGKRTLTRYEDLKKVFDIAYGVQTYAYDMYINDGTYNKEYEDKVRKAIQDGTWHEGLYLTREYAISEQSKDIPAGRAADPRFTFKIIQPPMLRADPSVKATRFIVKADVEFAKVPRGVFSLLIKPTGSRDEPRLAGVMTFFGTGHNHGSTDANAHIHDLNANLHEVQFEFDVTDKIQLDNFSGDVEFEVIPSNAADGIIIDKLQLVKKEWRER